MAREPANFREAFWELVRMQGLEPDENIAGGGLTALQLVNALMDFNRGYQRAYEWSRTPWEDAWTSGELAVNSGLVSYAQIDNASQFQLWSADPRPQGSGAVPVTYKSSDAGLHVQSQATTVYGFWVPAFDKFTATPYAAETTYSEGAKVLAADGHVYRCIQGGTGQTPPSSPTYWRLVPLIEVLTEAAIQMALASSYQRDGQHGTAERMNAFAEGLLDDQAAVEFPRVQTWWWIRRNLK